jgi:hypothetical protein
MRACVALPRSISRRHDERKRVMRWRRRERVLPQALPQCNHHGKPDAGPRQTTVGCPLGRPSSATWTVSPLHALSHSLTHLRFTPTPLRTAPFVPLAKLAIGILNGGPLYTYTRPVEHRHVATHTFSQSHAHFTFATHAHSNICTHAHTAWPGIAG